MQGLVRLNTPPIDASETTPWQNVLLRFQAALETLSKAARAAVIEMLISWLDHRCTATAQGYWLGHLRGAGEPLLALLIAYRDQDVGATSDYDLDWYSQWTRTFTEYLQVTPGSRCAQNRPMIADPPIMLFPKPMPDSSPDVDSPTVVSVTEPVDVDQLAEDEYQARQERRDEEAKLALEARERDDECSQHEAYLAHLCPEPTGSPTKLRRVMVFEMSSSSSDAPRTTRCLRVPVQADGVACLQLRCWRDDEPDPDEVPTPAWPAPASVPSRADAAPRDPPATLPDHDEPQTDDQVLLKL